MHSNTLILPAEAMEGLKANPELDALVRSASATVCSFIASNRLEFFPEYTDHDVSHLQDVVNLSYSIMTDESKELLTPLDHAILILSVLLHDLGMHITIDGFYDLVSDSDGLPPIAGLDGQSWSTTWDLFLDEARRFDDWQLTNLFGNNYRPVASFPSKGAPIDEFDRLLVGEFLRRHHHVLAHQIALRGLPIGRSEFFEVVPKIEGHCDAVADLAGLVARSHGTSLRDTFEYLEDNYDDRVSPRGSHPIYLMALLRTSDYLQIQADRAPLPRTFAVSMRSPISRREWKVHQCVKGLRKTDDPETITIDAMPKDVESFARLRWWLDDVQRELDNTWATLGEVFGLQHHTRLNQFGLKIRRIKSNIDDVEKLRRKVNFLPETIKIRTSNEELLKGLVGPLYGDYPGAGLRELVQNATDAVLELDELKGRSSIEYDYWPLDADIQLEAVRNDRGEFSKVILTDRGVGMTVDTIKNYFLNVGASYRSSKEWNTLHATKKEDSKRLRSGRFGVGILAGFLIGDRMTVQTRNYNSDPEDGLRFSVSISDDLVEITNENLPVGTRIEISVSDTFRQYLDAMKLEDHERIELVPKAPSPDWVEVGQSPGPLGDYYFEYPKFVVKIGEKSLTVAPSSFLANSQEGSNYSKTWNSFDYDDLKVLWTHQTHKPALSVNNFVVGLNSLNLNGGQRWSISCKYLKTPSVSVQDKFGSFPLDMKRSELAAPSVFFERDLIKSMTQKYAYDIVCRFLDKGTPRAGDPAPNGLRNFYGWHRTSSGILPGFPALFKAANVRKCYCVSLDSLDGDLVSPGTDREGVYSVQKDEFARDWPRVSAEIERFFRDPGPESFVEIEVSRVRRFAPLSHFFGLGAMETNVRDTETEQERVRRQQAEEKIERELSFVSGSARYCAFGPWLTDFKSKEDPESVAALASRLDASMRRQRYFVSEYLLNYEEIELSMGEEEFCQNWLTSIGSLEIPVDAEALASLRERLWKERYW